MLFASRVLLIDVVRFHSIHHIFDQRAMVECTYHAEAFVERSTVLGTWKIQCERSSPPSHLRTISHDEEDHLLLQARIGVQLLHFRCDDVPVLVGEDRNEFDHIVVARTAHT